MRFLLIDRVQGLTLGKSIAATKSLTLAEEYLADHFPRFPVMPGVLTLQACLEAASWLIRATNGFARNHIELRSLRALKYGQFVEPGDTLEITAVLTSKVPVVTTEGTEHAVKLSGAIRGRSVVSGRAVLRETSYSRTFHEQSELRGKIPMGATRPGEVVVRSNEVVVHTGNAGNTEEKGNWDDRAYAWIGGHFRRNFLLLCPSEIARPIVESGQ